MIDRCVIKSFKFDSCSDFIWCDKMGGTILVFADFNDVNPLFSLDS